MGHLIHYRELDLLFFMYCNTYVLWCIMYSMKWTITFHDDFDEEVEKMDTALQDALYANVRVLEEFGPQLGRPKADTLYGSQHSNMKELRFNHDGGVWRVAYAFDPKRNGILLVAGDKDGADQKLFYKQLIDTADQRFSLHLKEQKAEK